ncbi:hypothetical protein AB5J62_06805 [Amycolatopsis sp. cg5]|uniref:hypothetical protein n=1 Tax=Amycolatopsis sp. cg5 TaxID=3238802 RepID=UPI00352598BC
MPRIRGLSRRTHEAIWLLEERESRFHTASRLRTYQSALAEPGGLPLSPSPCPCCDPLEARDELEQVLRQLPPFSRAEFARLLAPLDDRLRSKTVPYPWPERRPWATAWWQLLWQEP